MSKKNFIQQIIEKDLADGKHTSVVTRFPPEPNGYLHIGHAKSICLNFGIAKKYGGRCHLRFDDTNPLTESTEYVESIKEDVKWLGFDWGEHLYFASDYFDQLYEWAIHLIKNGKAYVDNQTKDEIRKNRGSLTEPGSDSPFRTRTVEENLIEFEKMRSGQYQEGEALLRAKIDMTHPNMNMRDPPLYRVMHRPHHNTGDKWCIYPLYDYAHGQEDAIEHITHSICTLEFDNHRVLYDWFLDNLPVPSRPHQYEFARLGVTNTVMSKRKLLRLVKEGLVDGWDDPRMPTICGMRRRGVTPAALRDFCERVGVTQNNSTIDSALLDECIREDLDPVVHRKFAILDPIRVVIETIPESDPSIKISIPNHPLNPELGEREMTFSRELFIERDDFRENPPADYYRLKPDGRCKLRNAFVIKVDRVVKDDAGVVTDLICSHEPNSLHTSPKEEGVQGVIQWVSATDAVTASVSLFNPLILEQKEETPIVPDDEEPVADDFLANFNPNSIVTYPSAKLEGSVATATPFERFQFMRIGYFVVDRKSTPGDLRFNRIVALKESGLKKEESADNRSRKEEQARQMAAKEAMKKVLPEDFFKRAGEAEKYSEFDPVTGFPLKDTEGKELSKSAIKKLRKELEKHIKFLANLK
jgi:glutaminyl-tRNA synthetase